MSHFLPIVGLLTLIEVFVLSLLFDIQPLTTQSGLAALVGGGGGLVPLLFIGPLVLTMLRDATLHQLAVQLGRVRVPPYRAAAAFAAQLLAFGAFLYATRALLSASHPTDLQVLMWLCAAPLVPAIAWVVAWPDTRVLPLLQRAAPALLIGVALSLFVWSMGSVSAAFWNRLSPVVLIPVHEILQLTLTDVVYEPELRNVGTERFLVNISKQCSGLEGLGLLVSLAIITIFQRRNAWPWPQAVLLIVSAAVLSWVANVIRISLLVMIGDAGYEAVAIGGFHSKAGWVLYSLIALAMMVFVSRKASPDAPSPIAAAGEDPVLTRVEAFVGPVLAFTVAGLLTSLATADAFDPLYGLRTIVGGIALMFALRSLRPADLRDEPNAGAPAAAVGIGVLTYGIWLLLAPGPIHAPLVEGLTSMSTFAATSWVVARIVGTVIVVPWVEELAFRGYLLRRLSGEDFMAIPYARFSLMPVIISSLAFAAVHGAFVGGFAAAVLFAAAQAYGRRLRDAVIAHATTNALIVIQAFIEWPT